MSWDREARRSLHRIERIKSVEVFEKKKLYMYVTAILNFVVPESKVERFVEIVFDEVWHTFGHCRRSG